MPSQAVALYRKAILAQCLAFLDASSVDELFSSLSVWLSTRLEAEWCAIIDRPIEGEPLRVHKVGALPSTLGFDRYDSLAELADHLGCRSGTASAIKVTPPGSVPLLLRLVRQDEETHALILVSAGSKEDSAIAATTLDLACQLSLAALSRFKQVASLQRASATKSELVAAMSHELRSPLSAILGYTDLLREGNLCTVHEKLTDDQAAIVCRAHESAGRLHELIDAVLDISRLEIAHSPPAPETLDLLELLRSLLSANDHREFLTLAVASSAQPLLLHTRTPYLKRALKHLIRHAVSANPKEPLCVDAHTVGDHCEIEIRPFQVDRTQSAAEPRDGDSEPQQSQPGDSISTHIASRMATLLGGTSVQKHANGRICVALRLPLTTAS